MSMSLRPACAFLPAALLSSAFVAGAALGKDTAPFPASTASPTVYVIPMTGQMGTDIDKPIYDEIVKDVRRVKPDILVMELDSADFKFFSWTDNPLENKPDPSIGAAMLDEYRALVKMLRDDLYEYPQVMWVKNSMGWGTILAFSWPHLYMAPDARIIGVSEVAQFEKMFQDKDVAAKMAAAASATIKGFMEYGGYALELGDAILVPKHTLSASFVGRNVIWSLNTDGMWVVDSSTEAPAMFSATVAEDTGLADGIAESLDDLMFLLGYREYEQVGQGESIYEKYKQDWRRAFGRVEDWMRQLDNLPTGDDPIRLNGQRRAIIEKMVQAMKQYPAVERRLRVQRGPSRLDLEILLEQLREELRMLRTTGRGNRGGGGNAPGGGGLGGR